MRKRCGYTQEELADQIGVTAQAVSRWESGTGLPDVSFIVPLAQMLKVTTDELFGIASETCDQIYLKSVIEKARELVNVGQDADSTMKANVQLKAYYYLKEEADKKPGNYALLQECIDYGAGLSRYTDFYGYMSDRIEERDSIFQNCARKATVIIRYSSDSVLVDRAHNAMTWIYAHNKEFDKAKEHANALPSYESNMMRETMMAQIGFFDHGFQAEKICIMDNLNKLSKVVAKELSYDLEDFAWYADVTEAEEFGRWALDVAGAFGKFPALAEQWKHISKKLSEYVKIIESKKEENNR